MYQNGFQNIGGAGQAKTGYRYVVVGNRKIVELQIALHLLTDPGQSTNQLTALSVPDAIAPTQAGTPHMLNDKYSITFADGRADVSKVKDADGWWTGTGSFYIMHVTYTSDN